MARLHAMLSALCSLMFLLGVVCGLALFCLDWRIAIVVLIVGTHRRAFSGVRRECDTRAS